jgi:hypothetical protein
MPINYQPEGLGELYAKLAYQTGAAKANVQVAQEAREDRIRTEEWERQDRLEQARNALKEQAEMRAMSWEFEKMEIRSRNDFELEELQNRAKVMAAAEKEIQDQRQVEAKIKAIEDHPRLSPEEKENYVLEIRTGIKTATAEQKHQYTMSEIAARAATKGTSTPDVKDLLAQNKTMIDFQAEFKQDKKGTWQRKPTRAGAPVLPATKEEVAALTAYNAILAKNIPEIARLGLIQANGGTAPGTPPAVTPLKVLNGELHKQLPNGTWVPAGKVG